MSIYVDIHIIYDVYIHLHGRFSFVLMTGIYHGLSPPSFTPYAATPGMLGAKRRARGCKLLITHTKART